MHSKKRRILFLSIVALGFIIGNLALKRWETTLHFGDSNGYYCHLVSFFIAKDVGDYGKTIETLKSVNPNSADPREDQFGFRLTEKGRRYIKYTVGVPFMEMPFFFLGHAYASMSPDYEANGWTKPYLFAVGWAIIFYVLVGFYLLMDILSKYFSEKTAMLTVLVLAFATNLFYHSTYVTMSHGFLFFLHCWLIYLSYYFYQKPSSKLALGIGVSIGLITLCRVPEVFSVFVALLWGVGSIAAARERIGFFLKNYKYLLWAALGFFSIFWIQIAYWYYVSGKLFFDPYKGEGFDILHPHFWSAFFDFKNGWLIYTPVMFLSIFGFFVLRRYAKGLILPIFGFILPHAWLHYSYYAWTFFPSLGQRPMVETYPLLAFPLAACFAFLGSKKWWKWVPTTAVVAFSALNLFQTWQMREGVIWSERGTAAFYAESFGKLTLDRNAIIAYESNELQPDTADLTFVENLVFEGFETENLEGRDTTIVASGKQALNSAEEFIFEKSDFDAAKIRGHDYVRASVKVYMRGHDRNWNRDNCAILDVSFTDNTGRKRKGRSIRMAPFIGQTNWNIWSSGEQDMWGEAFFYVHVPKNWQPDWTMKVDIWNPHKTRLFYDDFSVDLYREK